jgi:DtxR family Mn-dependent transcriptional regulator
MAAAIGEPKVDPHGAPIPTRDGGIVEELGVRTLADLREGERARVARVSDEDAQRLRYLGSLGIVPGAIIEVVQRAPYGGPIAVLAEGETRQVGPELAAQVTVGPA